VYRLSVRFPAPASAVLLALLVAGAPGARRVLAEDDPPVLSDVEVRRGRVPQGDSWRGSLTVPEGVRRLAVVLSSDADLDLVLAGEGGTAMSRSPWREETVVLSADTHPPIAPGKWTVEARSAVAGAPEAEFEVTVLWEREESPTTLLPSRPVSLEISRAAPAAAFRTFFPRRADRLELTVEGADLSGLRFVLAGPDGTRREGPLAKRIVLERPEAPPGVYLLEVRGGAAGETRRLAVSAEWGTPSGASADAILTLEPGHPSTIVLGGAEHPVHRPFRFEVPEGTARVTLTAAAEAGRDVDLLLRRGDAPLSGLEEAEWFALSLGDPEVLRVGGDEPLPAGVYRGRATLFESGPRTEVTLRLEAQGAGEAPPAWGRGDPPILPLDTWVGGTVVTSDSSVCWHFVVAPPGATSLHLVLLDSSAPLDLVLARASDGAVETRALTGRVDERLDMAFEGRLRTERRLLVGVVSRDAFDEEVTYRIAAGVDGPPPLPDGYPWFPRSAARGSTPLERAVAGVVEITTPTQGGGSGACLTPRGLLLTCRHVVATSDEPDAPIETDGILVAFSRNLDEPPVQAFEARLLHEDAARDLALLEIVGDAFGRALPDDLRLPSVPLGDSTRLRLGESLVAIGFPECGSTRCRTPVVVSRGVLSGWERCPEFGRWLKTDAWIASGFSGGAVIDGEGRLIGVPGATLGETESLGLVVPVEALPASWRALVEEGQRR
jgi:S1-C subfamily serine protease